MATVETRVGRLEAATGGGRRPGCPECGWPHDGDPGDTYELIFDDDDYFDEPMTCEACGREIHEIVFPDDPRYAAPRYR
jgi:hypothetical protein